jgi:tRNA dimethylallyltransferase
MEMARLCRVAIISADSRQVYRGLDIGTAKPTSADREVVPHFGLDLVEPGETFSAGQFARAVQTWLRQCPDRQPLIVGGTGLYIKALTDGLFTQPPMESAALRRLRAVVEALPDVQRWACRLDPHYVVGGKQRAGRAVEVALLTGWPLSWWQRKSPGVPSIEPWVVRLTMPRETLHARIAARVRRMLDHGWIDEVRSLLRRGVAESAPGLDAVGYQEIVQHLRGQIALRDLEGKIALRTRQYAKRQETWFRNQLGSHRVLVYDTSLPSARIAEMIVDTWRKEN